MRLRNKRTGRSSGRLLTFGAVLSAAGLLLTAVPGVAAAADARKAPGLIAKLSVLSSQGLTPQATQIPAAVLICLPGVGGFNRFLSCDPTVGRVDFYVVENGVRRLVGYTTFQVEQADVLNAKSTTVTELLFIYDIVPHGETLPVALSLVVTCGIGCTGAAMPAEPLTAGASYTPTLHFVNSIGPNQVRANSPTYDWQITGGNDYIRFGRGWRCDNTFRRQRAGCVYAAFVPTVSMAGLKFITPSIKKIQAHGGPRQLHRNNFLTGANHDAVCRGVPGPGWTPPPGWPLPVNKPGGANRPQCDEYPFAGTSEGGTHTPRGQRGVAVVPAGENNSQGGRLTAFYLANRVLNATTARGNGDAFDVAT